MDQVFAQLLSAEDQKVLDALVIVEQQGDARAIRPLLHALAGSSDQQVRQRITNMLYQVKVSAAVPELVAALDEDGLRSVRRTVLSTFWNAGLDVKDHLEILIGCAIEGDAEECFECLTVIEHQELWPEKDARLALKRVERFLPTEKDAYKAALLGDLAALLRDRLGA